MLTAAIGKIECLSDLRIEVNEATVIRQIPKARPAALPGGQELGLIEWNMNVRMGIQQRSKQLGSTSAAFQPEKWVP